MLRGASSSLYGNASGGVISFQTERAAPARSPSGCGCRAATASGGDGFYKWQSWTSARSGDAGPSRSPSSRPTASASTARRVPAAQRRWRLGDERLDHRHRPAQPGGQPGGAEPRRTHQAGVRRQPRFRRANNIIRGRRQGRAAATARARAEALRRGGQRVQRQRSSACCAIWRTRSRHRRRRRRADQRHLRADRPRGGRRPGSGPAARRASSRRPGSPPAWTPSACATTGRTRVGRRARPPTPSPRSAGDGDRAGSFAQLQWSPTSGCW